LTFIKRREGFTSISAKWGAAWALSLLDVPLAEGLLQQLRQLRPNVATFAGLLAYTQNGRNKWHSAIANAERAVMLEPENRSIRWLLVHLLLVRGRVADAARQLAPMRELARTDVATALLFLRLALLERDLGAASEWAGVVRALSAGGEELVALGHLFGGVRLESEASTFFTAALEAGFTPEANLGLAAMATFRGDREAARRHLLAALRFDQAKFTKGETLPVLFHRILAQINALEDQKLECKAWIATFPLGQMLLAERSLVVCATSESSAREHLERIVTAMTGPAAFDLARVSWREAPAADQPVRPVQPGVKGIVA
jgi:tetratricopeptide (TPR) repeat protein